MENSKGISPKQPPNTIKLHPKHNTKNTAGNQWVIVRHCLKYVSGVKTGRNPSASNAVFVLSRKTGPIGITCLSLYHNVLHQEGSQVKPSMTNICPNYLPGNVTRSHYGVRLVCVTVINAKYSCAQVSVGRQSPTADVDCEIIRSEVLGSEGTTWAKLRRKPKCSPTAEKVGTV